MYFQDKNFKLVERSQCSNINSNVSKKNQWILFEKWIIEVFARFCCTYLIPVYYYMAISWLLAADLEFINFRSYQLTSGRAHWKKIDKGVCSMCRMFVQSSELPLLSLLAFFKKLAPPLESIYCHLPTWRTFSYPTLFQKFETMIKRWGSIWPPMVPIQP